MQASSLAKLKHQSSLTVRKCCSTSEILTSEIGTIRVVWVASRLSPDVLPGSWQWMTSHCVLPTPKIQRVFFFLSRLPCPHETLAWPHCTGRNCNDLHSLFLTCGLCEQSLDAWPTIPLTVSLSTWTQLLFFRLRTYLYDKRGRSHTHVFSWCRNRLDIPSIQTSVDVWTNSHVEKANLWTAVSYDWRTFRETHVVITCRRVCMYTGMATWTSKLVVLSQLSTIRTEKIKRCVFSKGYLCL